MPLQYSRACKALDNCFTQLRHLKEDNIVMKIRNIGHFRNNVIFAQIEEGIIPALQAIAGQCLFYFSYIYLYFIGANSFSQIMPVVL